MKTKRELEVEEYIDREYGSGEHEAFIDGVNWADDNPSSRVLMLLTALEAIIEEGPGDARDIARYAIKEYWRII